MLTNSSSFRQSQAVLAHDVEAQLSKIKAPTQITFGRYDLVTSTRFADPLQQNMQQAELVIFEGCAHTPIYEKVDEFNLTTLEFLQRHSGYAQFGENSMGCLDIPNETIFTMEMTPIKFGPGATDEVAYDLKRLGVKHTLIITDRGVMQLGLPDRVRTLIQEAGLSADIFDEVHVEQTDRSFEAIVAFVRDRDYDGFVAVGGGSSIDSAKAANLFTTYPAPLMDYVNKPIGKGLPVPGPLKPLLALPTTAGTGSETTATAIMDILSLKMKTGISHRYLRPTLAIIDPLNTVTLPPMATAYPGFDVLTHALESYTSRPYDARP